MDWDRCFHTTSGKMLTSDQLSVDGVSGYKSLSKHPGTSLLGITDPGSVVGWCSAVKAHGGGEMNEFPGVAKARDV